MEHVNIYRDIAKLKHIDIFYRDTKTEGPVILCLHGRWGRGETFVDFMQHYGTIYRIIAPDQRGHGLSGKPISTYTSEEMAADMVELLTHLHVDSAIVVGHSMGGRIAGYITALYPNIVTALAILDKSASGRETINPVPLEQLSGEDPLTKDWPMPFASLREAQDFLTQVMDSELSYQYFMNSLVERIDGYHMMFSAQAMAANIAYERSWFHLLPQIMCPVLLLRAHDNDAVSDEDFVKMQSLLPDCIAREVSHPDHSVHLGNKDEFYGYFDEFLKALEFRTTQTLPQ